MSSGITLPHKQFYHKELHQKNKQKRSSTDPQIFHSKMKSQTFNKLSQPIFFRGVGGSLQNFETKFNV